MPKKSKKQTQSNPLVTQSKNSLPRLKEVIRQDSEEGMYYVADSTISEYFANLRDNQTGETHTLESELNGDNLVELLYGIKLLVSRIRSICGKMVTLGDNPQYQVLTLHKEHQIPYLRIPFTVRYKSEEYKCSIVLEKHTKYVFAVTIEGVFKQLYELDSHTKEVIKRFNDNLQSDISVTYDVEIKICLKDFLQSFVRLHQGFSLHGLQTIKLACKTLIHWVAEPVRFETILEQICESESDPYLGRPTLDYYVLNWMDIATSMELVMRGGGKSYMDKFAHLIVNYETKTARECLTDLLKKVVVLPMKTKVPRIMDKLKKKCDQDLHKSLANEDYTKAASIATESQFGILRTREVISMLMNQGNTAAVTEYFRTLLLAGKSLNEYEPLFLSRYAIRSRRLDILRDFVDKDLLQCTMEIADNLREFDMVELIRTRAETDKPKPEVVEIFVSPLDPERRV